MNGIERLLMLQQDNAEACERMAALRPRFLQLAQRHELGTAPRAVTGLNLFQTPRPIAALMADILRRRVAGGRILEPSAGLGRLYEPEAVQAMRATWLMVEEAQECCNALRKAIEGADIRQRDFLATSADDLGGRFDGVIMNPPFKQGRDVKHIMHAMEMLKPGGRLVSLCYNGQRQRAALKPIAAEWRDLPAGSFREEGTDADVALVVFDK